MKRLKLEIQRCDTELSSFFLKKLKYRIIIRNKMSHLRMIQIRITNKLWYKLDDEARKTRNKRINTSS